MTLIPEAALGPLCAFGSSVTWAVGSAGYSRLARDHTPFAVNFARATVALPLFVIAAFALAGGWQGGLQAYAAVRPAHLAWFAVSMVASYGLGDSLFLWSTRSLGVPGALAIASCYPLFTAAAGVLFQGERLSAVQVLGLLLSVAGVAVVILNPPQPSTRSQSERREAAPDAPAAAVALAEQARPAAERRASTARGVAMAIVTSFFWALNAYACSRLGKDLSPGVANTVRMFFALALSAGFGFALARNQPILLPARTIGRSLWFIVFEAFGGSFVFLYGLGHSSLSLGATLSALAPVLSVPVSWALGLERFSLKRTLGVSCVVAGLAMLVGGY